MSDLKITFQNPWLLLLLIPALALTLWPYFRLNRKYRRTRNRITSIVLHLLIMVLSITVLSGAALEYKTPNLQNEIILLVDFSHSNRASETKKNEFIESVLDSTDGDTSIGIITFGYNQVYAAELSTDMDAVRTDYYYSIATNKPDTKATDIASALEFAKTKFNHPETGKIILMSDGIETDRKAMTVIVSLATEKIKVDTVHFPDVYGDEIQIVSIEIPQENIRIGEPVNIGLKVKSSYDGQADVTLVDEGAPDGVVVKNFIKGEQILYFEHVFIGPGLHKIWFNIASNGDTLAENNNYYSYVFINEFSNILILEKFSGESFELKQVLDAKGYDVEVKHIDEAPESVAALRKHHQVILMNIANSDMPDGFASILNDYVKIHGGGLFTIGGNELDSDLQPMKDPTTGEFIPHSYTVDDMKGDKLNPESRYYQELLPVDCINYTPPLALLIILDRSGSMGKNGSLDLAKKGAEDCVNALTERDYVAVMTFENAYREDIGFTSVLEKEKVLNVIRGIQPGGGTRYDNAFDMARKALSLVTDVERKHIIMVSDGNPADPDRATGDVKYKQIVYNLYSQHDITTSTVYVGFGFPDVMSEIASLGGGGYHDASTDPNGIPLFMKNDVKQNIIKAVNQEEFTVKIKDRTAAVRGIVEADLASSPLGGFYGTRAKKPDDGRRVDVALEGKYVPIYAQWDCGNGRVGSFMSTLNGDAWSQKFIESDVGKLFIDNVVKALFPIKDISAKEVDAEFILENNYTATVKIYLTPSLLKDEKIEITVIDPAGDSVATELFNGYTQGEFKFKLPGWYTVTITKIGADGQPKKDANGDIIQLETWTTFSYSSEYNAFVNIEDSKSFLENLALSGNGKLVSTAEPGAVYKGLPEKLDNVWDPTVTFIIIAVVLFLLDIAVRKFKFKWPWEIYRDRKVRKALEQGNN